MSNKQIEALKLALEALESRCGTNAEERGPDGAITAIREALSEPEEKYRYGTPLLDAMTGNAEQPAPPPECQTEAEKTAFAFGWWKALEMHRTPAQQQEPDNPDEVGTGCECANCANGMDGYQMKEAQQPEALRLANWLDAMPSSGYALTNQAAAELRRLHEEVTEQGRLLSMSAERELALLARIDRLEKLNAELLEALKDVVEDADDCGCHENDERCPLRHAEKIIAKATGEQA